MNPGPRGQEGTERTFLFFVAHRQRHVHPLATLLCDRLGEQRLGLLQMRREPQAERFDPPVDSLIRVSRSSARA